MNNISNGFQYTLNNFKFAALSVYFRMAELPPDTLPITILDNSDCNLHKINATVFISV